MIRSIRMRPAEKPFITKQTIYNHNQQEQVDTHSELSFLKLSENASSQQNETDPYKAMEMMIYKVEQRAALRLNEVQCRIGRLQNKWVKDQLNMNSNRELIQENKENLRMAYRKIPLPVEQNQELEGCNFQMDENFNYVKSKQGSEGEDCLGWTGKVQIISKEFYSLENSRKSQETKRIIRYPSGSLSGLRSKTTSQTSRKSKPTSKDRIVFKQPATRSQSSQPRSKKGKIYEQILSLYSIPKLLAMELKAE